MKSRIFFVLAAMSAAATLIASPNAGSQQRRTAPIASFRADAGLHAGRTFHPANRAGPLGRRRRVRFHEHRRMRVAGPLCVNGGLSPALLPEFPNSGFDFEHLNTLDADLATKAAIDPATQLRLRETEDAGCAIGEPWDYLEFGDDDGGSDEESQQTAAAGESETEPPIVILQESPASPATAQTKPREAPEPKPPLPDEGQFVLVLRDGSRLEAVAFSRSVNQVVYITTEGTRETLPLSGLDLETTLRVNEERGTPLDLSF